LYQNKKALLEKAVALKKSNEELEQYAYVVSHDLREPLRGISSYLNFLKEDYLENLDDNGQMFINEALKELLRLNGMIEAILNFSKLTKELKELAPVDCQLVYNKALSNLRISIEESGAIIKCDELPTINGDDHLLLQLFQNLIGNAIKYRAKESPIIHVTVNRRQDECIFCIEDNGIGISPSKFDKIFVIFQRLHHQKEYSGTGIGLSICKKIVEHHRGKIWVEPGKEKGSIFKFTLPIS